MRANLTLMTIALLGAVGALGACQKERPPKPSDAPAQGAPDPVNQALSPPAQPSAAPKVEEPSPKATAAKRGVTDAGALELSVEEFEAIVIDVAVCEVGPRGISRTCEPYQRYRTAKRRRGAIDRPWRQVDSELATRLLAHEDAAVRFVAAELMGPLLQASFDTLKPLLEATRREVHPGVVKSFVKRLGPSTYHHEEVRELMMVLGAHLDERVRLEVGNWLTAAQGLGTPGILERAMRMVREDPSERVRLRVLDDLGDSGDERVLPFLEPYLRSAKKSPRGHASAVRALINMWSSPIPKAKPSRAAYLRTLKLLSATPRDEDTPPWAAIGGLRWVIEPRFLAKAEWFDKGALISALEGLILDVRANEKARKAAVELLIRYDEPKARFASLLERCQSAQGKSEVGAAVVELLRSVADPTVPLTKPGPQRVNSPQVPIPSPKGAPAGGPPSSALP